MKDKKKVLADYKIFGSEYSGAGDFEARVNILIQEKETPENLNKLAKVLFKRREIKDENVVKSKLSFSAFEQKLEERKAEIFRIYEVEKLRSLQKDKDQQN